MCVDSVCSSPGSVFAALEGMASEGAPKPSPQRGDWCITRYHRYIRCRQYLLPPFPHFKLRGRVGGNIPEGTYLGPVHDVIDTGTYVAVYVPTVPTKSNGTNVPVESDEPALVWVSIWCAHKLTTCDFVNYKEEPVAVRFAAVVHPWELKQWFSKGWENSFTDGEGMTKKDWSIDQFDKVAELRPVSSLQTKKHSKPLSTTSEKSVRFCSSCD